MALELVTLSASREVREAWSRTMVQLRGVPGVDITTPIHTKIALLHESGLVTDLQARNNILSLIFPRTKLLDHVDSAGDRTMALLQLSDTIRPHGHNFEDMMSNPAQFQIHHIVNLYE